MTKTHATASADNPDHNGLARTGLGGHCGEPAGAQYVRGGQQRRDQVLVGQARRGDQGAIGERDAGSLRLRSYGAHKHPVEARALVPGLADLTGIVRGPERANHELTGLDRPNRASDLLHDAHILVPHRRRLADRLYTTIVPQIGPAYAGGRDPDDGVRWFDNLRVGTLLEAHVPGTVKHGSSHS